MLFVAPAWHFHFGEGEYLRVLPEHHRLGDPAPAMVAGDDLLIGGKPAEVLSTAGADAVIAFEGAIWFMSQMTPAEMPFRPVFQPGEGCQEWIVRRRIG